MIKKSRDGKFVIDFLDETNVEINAVEGFSPTVFDLAIAVDECFRPEPHERLNVDALNIKLKASDKLYELAVERKHCLLIYLEEISKQIVL